MDSAVPRPRTAKLTQGLEHQGCELAGGGWWFYQESLHIQGIEDESFEAASLIGRSRRTCAVKGDKDQAFEWLQLAVDAGWNDSTHMDTDENLDSLRDDPRYTKLIALLGDDKRNRP